MQSKHFSIWFIAAFAFFGGALAMASYIEYGDTYQHGTATITLLLTILAAISFSVAIEIHLETADAVEVYEKNFDTIIKQTGYRFRLADGTISLIVTKEFEGYMVRPVYNALLDVALCLDTTTGEIRPDNDGGPYVFDKAHHALAAAENYLHTENKITYEQQPEKPASR